MKRFVIALALTCILSGSAFAGDIPMDAHGPTPTALLPTTSITTTVILTIISLVRR